MGTMMLNEPWFKLQCHRMRILNDKAALMFDFCQYLLQKFV